MLGIVETGGTAIQTPRVPQASSGFPFQLVYLSHIRMHLQHLYLLDQTRSLSNTVGETSPFYLESMKLSDPNY